MKNTCTVGHSAALITIIIWGTTFISTKVLLAAFSPVEILFFRFAIGLLALLLIYPHRMPKTTRRQEALFALAGLCGICLYFLLENIALTYTLASNVGIILSIAPFFTALLTHFFGTGEDMLRGNFFLGFGVAMAGICMIHVSGAGLKLNPAGDLLAIAAALVWACYALLTRKISALGYPIILTTRRVFFYGILFMLPVLALFRFQWGFARFTQPVYLFNMLFLGLGASALCFVTWNFAVKVLGAVQTSAYIYLVPVITVATSVLVLREPITPLAGAGAIFTLMGLFLSEYKPKRKEIKDGSNG